MKILITGGTGSLGRALIRHYLDQGAKRVVCFSRDEWKQAEMAEEFNDSRLRFFLGDVRDKDRLNRALFGITHCVHAAALKRVDAVSYNPSEVVKTNVQGTMNVVDACIEQTVNKVVVVSSDKAVNPQNIYGASKFMAEQYAIDANSYGKPQGTIISCVRYGNVLGSRGSVIHVFKKQAAAGGPIKITDPRCTRFLITMKEAVGLIGKAFALMKGGEIFVPCLPSVNLFDFARAIAPEENIVVVGLRSGGEKLHEVLINEDEWLRTTECGHGYVINGSQGEKVPDSFTYRSDTVRWRLDREQIREVLQAEGYL